jgi:hypothetical protein
MRFTPCFANGTDAVKVLCFDTVSQVLILNKLVGDEFSPLRRREMRRMALRELGQEPVPVLA